MKKLLSLVVALLAVPSVAFGQVTPYDGDVATAVGYFTTEFYDAAPVILGAITLIALLWFAFRLMKKTALGGNRKG